MDLDPVFLVVALLVIAYALAAGLEKIANALTRDKTINLHVVVTHKREEKPDGPL